MYGITKARQIAKDYLESKYGQTIYTAQQTLRVAWNEYQRRIDEEGHSHLSKEQMNALTQRISGIVEKQFNVVIERHEQVPSVSEDQNEIIEKDMVKISINTKYLCVNCWDGQEFETELNLDGEVLVGLIYTIHRS